MKYSVGRSGVFSKFKKLIERNRLGELLVSQGVLTSDQLDHALARHHDEGQQLGRVLVAQNMVSRRRLYQTLVQQWTLRSLAAALSFTIMFSACGIKEAKASAIKDIPPQLNLVSAANAAFAPVSAYPALFGSKEQLSRNLGPFTKWSDMFARFEREVTTAEGKVVMANWKSSLDGLEGLPLKAMAQEVNTYVNQTRYVTDMRNWGKSDYWATPIEFFTRGGDCEDFAIAKYASLRALGVPEERLRLAIVHDKVKDIPHAILIVYTDSEALILDNQAETVRASARVDRYKPIFSINRHAWWLHTAPKTILASAE